MIPMTTLEKMIKYRTDQYDFSDDGIWENELILMALKELQMYRTRTTYFGKWDDEVGPDYPKEISL